MDLTLTDAWALWWSGQQLTDHTLYGAPVLWLGRAGKMLAFLAGCTIVLDLIGAKRLVTWGKKIQGESNMISYVVALAWFFGSVLAVSAIQGPFISFWDRLQQLPLMILSSVGVSLVFLSVLLWGPALAAGLGRLLERPRFERWLRAIAVPLFFVGFALDYLAS